MAIRTIVALFDDYREAESAIRELEAAGIPSTDVNLIANNTGNRYGDYPQYGIDRPAPTDNTNTGSGAGKGAGIGAVLGGAAGLLAGIGALAIPGVGPIVAAGALAATLAGAGVGAAVGGLVGALVEAGIPRDHADIYAEAVRRGGTLVTVRADEIVSDRVSDILNRHSPVDIEERAESWRQAGWSGFDERAEPYAGSFHGDRPAATIPGAVAAPPPPAGLDHRPEPGAGPIGSPGELQRDWEVRRDPSEVSDTSGRNYVRIYPRVEEPASDKR
jgi:hypothetical protein